MSIFLNGTLWVIGHTEDLQPVTVNLDVAILPGKLLVTEITADEAKRLGDTPHQNRLKLTWNGVIRPPRFTDDPTMVS